MALGCARWGLDWILGEISSLKGWSDTEVGCPGWNYHPWKCSKNMRMWHLETRLGGGFGSAGLAVGLDVFRGLFPTLMCVALLPGRPSLPLQCTAGTQLRFAVQLFQWFSSQRETSGEILTPDLIPLCHVKVAKCDKGGLSITAMNEMAEEQFCISMHCSAFCLVREGRAGWRERRGLPERRKAPSAQRQHCCLESLKGSQIMLMDLPAFEPAQLWQEMLGA